MNELSQIISRKKVFDAMQLKQIFTSASEILEKTLSEDRLIKKVVRFTDKDKTLPFDSNIIDSLGI